MGCPTELTLCIVRGDSFQQTVSFSATGWEDVVDNPELYEGRMVFRERQDDSVPDLLTLTALIQIEAGPTYSETFGDLAIDFTRVEWVRRGLTDV